MITQLINNRGNAVKNQFVITKDDRTIFQSYKSIIAHKYNTGKIVLDSTYWDYSVTTLRHLKTFLNTSDTKKQIQIKIDTDVYFLADLNGGKQ